jgi:hypothetical protein
MVKGVESRRKHYVEVLSRTDEDGHITPVAITWEDGRTFEIDRILDRRQAASLKVGGTGMRYLIRIGHATTYLFHEDPRWFVEEKVGQRFA